MFDAIAGLLGGRQAEAAGPPTLAVSDLPGYKHGYHTGDKWGGGFGVTEVLAPDYWTLRMRSAQLFKTNHYCRGLIRRILTAKINTGLHLEADPFERLLGMAEDSLAEWSEDVELRFSLWGKNPQVCDLQGLRTFGKLQWVADLEAFVSGDVLVLAPQDQATRLPRVQLVNGANVQTPFPEPKVREGHRIVHGVEIDKHGRHMAFWVRQPDQTSKRIAAVGEKSGRRLAWLHYGNDLRYGEVRGEPLMGIMLQALHDLDRYRDATLRKAVLNSFLAMFVTREGDAAPSRGIGAGAIVKGTTPGTDSAGKDRTWNVGEFVPGLIIDSLAPGEDIKPGTQGGADLAFGPFEEMIVQAVAWVNEVPPEILKQAFSNNYSASQAAIQELKLTIDRWRMELGAGFCQPIYENWLLSMALLGSVSAPGLLESYRDRRQWETYGAWVSADWTGHVKPSTDPAKLVKASDGALAQGATTFDRVAREYSGTKFSRNIKKQARERKMLEAAGIVPPGAAPAAAPAPTSAPPSREDGGTEGGDEDPDNDERED